MIKRDNFKKSNSHFEFLFNNNLLNSKRSQITIFIIIALIIVVVILMLFSLMRNPKIQTQDVENPQAYIDSCTRQVTEEAINLLSEQGGDITPEGSTMFQGRNITYLCYSANFYEQCIMQRPDLINHIENQITNYIQPKVENCFQALKAKLDYRH
jgi:predicted nucleic acid-binding Zn ribbon protein